MTSRHPDAIGYLNDLSSQVNEPWFTMLCDLVTFHGLSALDQKRQDELFTIFLGQATYLRVIPIATVAAVATTTTTPDFLEELARFNNFKRLGDSLTVSFDKRVTLIFGANGSGKSSICEALKVLAKPEASGRPLRNVQVTTGTSPEFSYKFQSDATQQLWTEVVGYGPRNSTIKYFDSEIALKNLKSEIEPGRIVELAPFKLYVFEWAKALTVQFREVLQEAQQKNLEKLRQACAVIREKFTDFQTSPLSSLSEYDLSCVENEIKIGEAFTGHELLGEKRAALKELVKATSDEGLKLLKAEYRELNKFIASLSQFLQLVESLWILETAKKLAELATKKSAQAHLAKELIPESGSLEELRGLLHASQSLVNLESAAGQHCPLCKQGLTVKEVALFAKYHELLVNDLEREITSICEVLEKAKEFGTQIQAVDREDWRKCCALPEALLTKVTKDSGKVVECCGIENEVTDAARMAFESLRVELVNCSKILEQKEKAIGLAETGREGLIKQLTKLQEEVKSLEYAQLISDQIGSLRSIKEMGELNSFWASRIPSFIQILKKITEAAKEAHEELVVSDFERRLDGEYRAITEKSMTAFGVQLARRGADASVTVLPKIGGNEIDSILSEGEQRVHALALFFAELESCSQSVLVFDDPVSSFDYNYIANYCTRLRDYTVTHPTQQIIVLTHNWEFFVQMQTTLNQGGLNGHLSVQVLENCVAMDAYSEDCDCLKADIEAILAIAGEPSRGQKEELAGKMRRLMESVVNTHVFNKQRHQYKQKNLPVSAYHAFTKLVPLLPAEATELRDLFSRLSVTEHDDPRNAYVNTDKAVFQTRYDRIQAIEADLIARKQP